jgi:hypothetical protein
MEGVLFKGSVWVERVMVWWRDFGDPARFLDAQTPVADEFRDGGGSRLALTFQSALADVVHEARDELRICRDVFAVQRPRKHLARE